MERFNPTGKYLLKWKPDKKIFKMKIMLPVIKIFNTSLHTYQTLNDFSACIFFRIMYDLQTNTPHSYNDKILKSES